MVDELLDRIAFSADELPHPVDLLTVDRIARRAGVPPTSLDSAITSAAMLRNDVLMEAIRSLNVVPGDHTWAALRSSVMAVRGNVGDGADLGWVIAPIIAARAQELAEDPAFPFLLSGFDRFDTPQLALVCRQILRHVFRELWPFIATACVGSPLACRDVASEHVETVVTIMVTADAYRRLLGATGLDAEHETALSGVMATATATVIELDAQPKGLSPLVAPPIVLVDRPNTTALTDVAVRAGAALLLDHDVEFSTSISVAEARRRTGLSNTAFYRTFGSLPELDQLILARSKREIAGGFSDGFFEDVLADLRAGDYAGGVQRLAEHHAAHQRTHVIDGRPGRQLVPWLGHDDVRRVIAAAYKEAFRERGAFYAEFAETVGANLRTGFDGPAVAGTLNAVSVVTDYFVRVSPDREGALAWAASSLPYFNRHFVS